MTDRIQGFQSQRDGKRLAPPLTPQELGERWACLATFFLALGWLRSPQETEPALAGNRRRAFFLAGQTS